MFAEKLMAHKVYGYQVAHSFPESATQLIINEEQSSLSVFTVRCGRSATMELHKQGSATFNTGPFLTCLHLVKSFSTYLFLKPQNGFQPLLPLTVWFYRCLKAQGVWKMAQNKHTFKLSNETVTFSKSVSGHGALSKLNFSSFVGA